MALGIYKHGQGYWTRVLSAAGFGALALSTAAWLWNELEALNLDDAARTYVQAGVALGVMALAGWGVYWFTGFGKKPVEFLIATDGEMRKVHWSTRREIQGMTWVVIGVSVILSIVLFFADTLFAFFFRAIGVIEA